jgi:hypothetical protein
MRVSGLVLGFIELLVDRTFAWRLAPKQERNAMIEQGPDEARELLVGTWIGIALIAEMLIRNGAAPREGLISVLSDAEALEHFQNESA